MIGRELPLKFLAISRVSGDFLDFAVIGRARLLPLTPGLRRLAKVKVQPTEQGSKDVLGVMGGGAGGR